ncbi:MAG: hypothetical protein AAGH43_13820 [Pseudomonadota bacterium]
MMRRSTLCLLASTGLALFAGVPAVHAQSVDAAGATDVEERLDAMLTFMTENIVGLSYRFAAAPRATPNGDSYTLTLPGLSLEQRDLLIELPNFEAEITPVGDGWYRADWDFPTSISMRNPRGNERIDGSFSSDDNTLTFAPEYGVALQGNVSFEEMAFTVSEENVTALIDGMQMVIDTDEEDAPHTFSTESEMSLSGLIIDVPGEGSVQLDEALFEGASESQRLDLFALFNAAVRGLEPESEEYLNAMLNVVSEHRDETWAAGLRFSSALEGLRVDVDGVDVSMERLATIVGAGDLDQASADLEIAFDMAGLETNQVPPAFAEVAPNDITIDVTAEDLPIQQIMNVVYDALGPLGEEAVGPKGRRAGAGPTVEQLQSIDPMVMLGLLLGSEAKLAINELLVEAPIGYLDASGVIEPDPNAAFQAVGSLDISIAGLADIIAFTQQMGGDAAQFAALASAIAAMGEDSTDGDGVAVKEFALEVTAAGQVLLNGNDMSAMMGMFQ